MNVSSEMTPPPSKVPLGKLNGLMKLYQLYSMASTFTSAVFIAPVHFSFPNTLIRHLVLGFPLICQPYMCLFADSQGHYESLRGVSAPHVEWTAISLPCTMNLSLETQLNFSSRMIHCSSCVPWMCCNIHCIAKSLCTPDRHAHMHVFWIPPLISPLLS